jgi:hypothetical protein
MMTPEWICAKELTHDQPIPKVESALGMVVSAVLTMLPRERQIAWVTTLCQALELEFMVRREPDLRSIEWPV